MSTHNDTVVDQFTRQADAFSASAPIRSEQALALLVDACSAGPDDESLDVACGPGLVACAFAAVVRHATGVDITPAMLAKATALSLQSNLANTTFRQCDVNALPFADHAFSIVTSRYAFHHFAQPDRVMADMVRVCRPGGRVAVMDMVASDDPGKAARFNRMERLRDPSHVRGLTLAELVDCFARAGLPQPAFTPYRMPVELDALMATSFPHEGDRDAVRDLVTGSLENDSMGVNTRLVDGRLWFDYPIAILSAMVPQR